MSSVSIFTRVLDILFPPTEEERIVRTLSEAYVISLHEVVASHDGSRALLHFMHPHVRALIHRAKYANDDRAIDLLACVLHRYLATLSTPHTIVPIPLAAGRLRERGYNQCERIARRAVIGTIHSCDTTLLCRTRETTPQTHLSRRERRTNMSGAFGITRDLSTTHPLIILDDVVTTGTTLDEAARTLRQQGVRRITKLALAH